MSSVSIGGAGSADISSDDVVSVGSISRTVSEGGIEIILKLFVFLLEAAAAAKQAFRFLDEGGIIDSRDQSIYPDDYIIH